MMTIAPPERKRICIFGLISKHASRNRGGTAIVVRRLADFFYSQGILVDILLRATDADHFLFDGLDKGINIQQIHSRSKLGLYWHLCGYVMRNKPHVLLALDSRANLIASWLAFLPASATKLWASFHSELNPHNARMLRRIVRRSHGIITISKGLAEDFSLLTGVPIESVHVLPNLVVTPDMEACAKQPVSHPWLQDKEYPILIGVGRLVKEKGFDYLLEAVALVQKTLPEIRLIILGDGPLRSSLQKLAERLEIANCIDFAGFQKNPWAYMAKADLCVVPSLKEAFGNVIAEALSLGTPVVASDCPHGPAEILEGGLYGRLVPPADSEALAQAIIATLHDPLPQPVLIEAAQRYRESTAGRKYLLTLGLNSE